MDECRICLQSQVDYQDLLLKLPCDCQRGTMAYCHAKCLSKYDINKECDICWKQFPLEWHEVYIAPMINNRRRSSNHRRHRSRTPTRLQRIQIVEARQERIRQRRQITEERRRRVLAAEEARRRWVEQNPELAARQERRWALRAEENRRIAQEEAIAEVNRQEAERGEVGDYGDGGVDQCFLWPILFGLMVIVWLILKYPPDGRVL